MSKDYKNWSKENLIDEIQKLKKRKKYGLVWDENEKENVVLKCKNQFPILKEVKDKELKFKDVDINNIIIEGDNYHSLSILNYTHNNSVDIIYIDPPYNRGSDLIYNDKLVEKTDSYKHSKWSSYMHKRLVLCKELLKDDGIIFISIDDHEFAQLKIICDEVFNHNSRGIFVWQKKYGGGNDSGSIANEHEYILSYSKNKNTDEWLEPHDEKYLKRYKEEDKIGRFFWDTLERPGLKNPINVKINFESKTYNLKTFRSQKRINEDLKKGEIRVVKLDNNKISFQFKQRLREGKLPRSILRDSKNEGDQDIFLNKIGSNSSAKNELKEIFGEDVFSNPKPTSLIKYLISLNNNKNAIVLDFFAGSGTTGHAVLNLNEFDGGKRSFILCTNNENNICKDITYPRIKKIINGYKYKEKKYKPLKSNLKYFETCFIPGEINDKNKILLSKKITEMICLKENTFDIHSIKENFQIFSNHKNYTCIIFDNLNLNEVKNEIKKLKGHIKVYIFSLGGDLFENDFEIYDNVEVEPIPQPILSIYKRIFSVL